MFAFLKDHPFSVEAFFESSLVLTFAVPKQQVRVLVPECLQLDTFDDHWAFIAVAMVQTKDLRPKGFPRLLGNDFFLIGYRVFVRFTTPSGKKLRGLYILRSETDKRKMEVLGNIFTHYSYRTTDIHQLRENGTLEISSKRSGFRVRIDSSPGETISLPAGSPFPDWKQARKYAGPLPFTFTCNSTDKKVLIIEGVRENWVPEPAKVIEQHFTFLDSMRLEGVRLANAFLIRDVPYSWKKGRIERWK
ncbi:MAG TPA: DUF2071 domain-containing protein [Puia sp.]|nr:DUF2071 domain-containing protein [Puia sp.]